MSSVRDGPRPLRGPSPWPPVDRTLCAACLAGNLGLGLATDRLLRSDGFGRRGARRDLAHVHSRALQDRHGARDVVDDPLLRSLQDARLLARQVADVRREHDALHLLGRVGECVGDDLGLQFDETLRRGLRDGRQTDTGARKVSHTSIQRPDARRRRGRRLARNRRARLAQSPRQFSQSGRLFFEKLVEFGNHAHTPASVGTHRHGSGGNHTPLRFPVNTRRVRHTP